MDQSGSTEGGRGRPADGGPLGAEERREYERLRAAAAVRHRRLRYSGASVLLLLALLLAPVAVVSAWLDDTVSDTDRYVQTVAPVAADPAVQKAVTDRLTNRVVAHVDVRRVTAALADSLAKAGAPPAVVEGARALTVPLTNALTSAVREVVSKVVTSDQFRTVWTQANKRAHAAVVNTLTGEGGSAVQAQGDTIVLDIGTVVDNVKQRLTDAGFEKAAALPDVDRQIPLLQVDKLNKAQDAMRLLNTVGLWLPVVVVALVGLAVRTAPARRAWLLGSAVGVGVMMALLLIGLALMRRVYLDSVPPTTLPPDAAAAVYDTFVRFLREGTRTVLVVAVITGLAAYLYGPGRGARAVRTAGRRATEAVGRTVSRAGLRTGAAGRWLDGHRSWTSGVVIGAGALALLLWNHPTPGTVALVLGLVLLVMALLGTLAAAAGGPARARTGPTADTERP